MQSLLLMQMHTIFFFVLCNVFIFSEKDIVYGM